MTWSLKEGLRAVIEPKDILKDLGKDVIAQDHALKEMSVAIYKHLIGHSAGNVLLIGNSGTGKTTIMKAAERFFRETKGFEKFSTIIRVNANVVADLAARGSQTNMILDRLAQTARQALGEKATLEKMRDYVSHGIVNLDEVDKIRASVGGEPNVKGIVAQDSLLTLLENENVVVELPYFDNGWTSKSVPINTQHILFVAGGAFEELYNMVYDRVTEGSGLTNLWRLIPKADGTLERRVVFRMGDHMRFEDLFRYGMTPQFIARFDGVIMLHDLTAPDLIRIFTEIPGALFPIAKSFFAHNGIELKITPEAMRFIADRAAEQHRLGARALREVFGRIIKHYEFDPRGTGEVKQTPEGEVLEITRDAVKLALDGEE